ncbi:MAG: DUF4832 domain-containing protein [Ruminococcus sp.]|nr:DUF4832 domain-containing protein [Ruminococcus sp.]
MQYRSFSRIAGALLSALLAAAAVPAVPADSAGTMKDSGLSYTEYVGTISNPAAGYTTTSWYTLKPGEVKILDPSGSLVLFFIDIGAYSSGANGTTTENADGTTTYTEGTDYDLDDSFFESLRGTFENCRKNGSMIALRFRYDATGKDAPEPSSFDQVLAHIQQVKSSGILEEYADILAFVESGTVGKWGEQHGGKYTSLDHKVQILDAWVNAVPDEIPVTVRTPDIFAKWAGIERSQLDDDTVYEAAEISSDSSALRLLSKRIGLYNDGYMGSDSDLGTFANRETETNWLGRVCTNTYYGGEFSGAIDFAKQYDTYLPENAIPEMYKTHLSYINGNIFQLYKDYTFGGEYDVPGCDNSAYYGQTVFQFIRDHIGYRFVLRRSELSESAVQGGELAVNFSVENTGFANPIPPAAASVLLERDGVYYQCELDDVFMANSWLSQTTSEEDLSFTVPGGIEPGEWNVYLKITMGNNGLDQLNMRSVRFANEGVWNSSLGANLLGKVTINKSDTPSSVYRFTETGSSSGHYGIMDTRGHITVDGEISSDTEWTEDMLIGENGDNKVYMTADESNIYIMGQLPDTAAAPVYNLRLTRADGESYWLYYQSNGFVYFNHDGRSGDSCRHSGNTVEFKIPLSMMGLEAGTELSLVRLFLQDSANEWKLLGEVNSGECTVPAGIQVYSACDRVWLTKDEPYYARVLTTSKNASYQWYHDGIELPGETSRDLTISDGSDEAAGLYSVRITSSGGAEKMVDMLEAAEYLSYDPTVPPVTFYGDANVDKKVNMADAVAVLQCLANEEKYPLTEQGRINADCDKTEGLTGTDAITIQMVDAGVYQQSELPLR